MPKRIDKLTPAQIARFDEWADKWIEIGLRTGDADRPKFEAAVRKCYRAAGLAEPKVIVWTTSPLVVSLAGPIAALRLRDAVGDVVDGAVKGAVRDAVRDAVDDAVGDAVGGAVDDAVGDAVRGAVRGAVGGAVRDGVGAAVDDAVRGAVRAAVGSEVRDAVGGAVGGAVGAAVDRAVGAAVRGAVRAAVGGAVRDAVRAAVGGAVRAAVRELWANYIGGQFWVGGWWWGGAWTSYFREVAGLELPGDLWARSTAYEATMESACHWFAHRDFVIVSERPVHIHRELANPSVSRGWNSHRLHSETEAAVLFRDGWGVYSWHGVRVPAFVITAPETITIDHIRGEENAEVRRVMMERMGWDKFCEQSEMIVLHEDQLHSHFPSIPVSELVSEGHRLVTTYRAGTETAQLLEAKNLKDFEDRPLRFVRLADPSTGRQYTIRVLHSHERCYEAVGWTFPVKHPDGRIGLTEAEYKKQITHHS